MKALDACHYRRTVKGKKITLAISVSAMLVMITLHVLYTTVPSLKRQEDTVGDYKIVARLTVLLSQCTFSR